MTGAATKPTRGRVCLGTVHNMPLAAEPALDQKGKALARRGGSDCCGGGAGLDQRETGIADTPSLASPGRPAPGDNGSGLIKQPAGHPDLDCLGLGTVAGAWHSESADILRETTGAPAVPVHFGRQRATGDQAVPGPPGSVFGDQTLAGVRGRPCALAHPATPI